MTPTRKFRLSLDFAPCILEILENLTILANIQTMFFKNCYFWRDVPLEFRTGGDASPILPPPVVTPMFISHTRYTKPESELSHPCPADQRVDPPGTLAQSSPVSSLPVTSLGLGAAGSMTSLNGLGASSGLESLGSFSTLQQYTGKLGRYIKYQ